MEMKLKNRAVGVINITSTGSLVLTLTNAQGQLSRSRWSQVSQFVDNIQNIGWHSNNLADIQDDPAGAIMPGEKVKHTIMVAGSDQFTGGSLTMLPAMIVQIDSALVVFPGGTAISSMAEYLAIRCTQLLAS